MLEIGKQLFKLLFVFMGALCVAFSAQSQSPSPLEASLYSILPEPVSNNAVCAGWVDGVPHLFSFGGIDSTLSPAGIHLRSFAVNLNTGVSFALPNLPDTAGKIASGASFINGIIYIVGGYYVNPDSTELSSNKVHRFDVNSLTFLPDAAEIPTAIDDHVQAVWRDSLLYVVSGWSNFSNSRKVQVYNPGLDQWTLANNLTNTASYKCFGCSGVFLGDTLFYFGGATSSNNFPIQNYLRKGVIEGENPTSIDWSWSKPNLEVVGYRTAATTVGLEVHFIGGSQQTYNFNGNSYADDQWVGSSNRDLVWTPGKEQWDSTENILLPMDLRGIAKVNDSLQYLAGGLLPNGKVSDRVIELRWTSIRSDIHETPPTKPYPYPNPTSETLHIPNSIVGGFEYRIFDTNNTLLQQGVSQKSGKIAVKTLPKGTYFIQILSPKQTPITFTFIKS